MIARLEIELSRRCGLSCSHCSVAATPTANLPLLSTPEWLALVEEFKAAGGEEVVITGGEPLLHPGVAQILDRCREIGLQTKLYTAAYLPRPLMAAATKADVVCVSLEGDEASHDAITRVAGSYRLTLRAIQDLTSSGARVVLHFTPTRQNVDSFPHVARVAKAAGVEAVKILRLTPNGRGRVNLESLALGSAGEETLSNGIEVARLEGVEIRYGGVMSAETDCGVGRKLLVTSDGMALPCLGLRDCANLSLGNVLEEPFGELLKRARANGPGCLCANANREALDAVS